MVFVYLIVENVKEVIEKGVKGFVVKFFILKKIVVMLKKFYFDLEIV